MCSGCYTLVGIELPKCFFLKLIHPGDRGGKLDCSILLEPLPNEISSSRAVA